MDISEIHKLSEEALEQIDSSKELVELEDIRVQFLGKKGKITSILHSVKDLSNEEKPKFGKEINIAKQKIVNAINTRKESLEAIRLEQELSKEAIDVTLSGRDIKNGSLHPISLTIYDFADLFNEIGFSVFEGPEIETEYYNFEALNTPENHPARDMHDTFYVENDKRPSNNKLLLRSHTSPTQIHAVQKYGVPIRILVPGKAYRCDSDVTHTPMFHQIEGLMIDDKTNFADLKGILHNFLQKFFNKDDLKVRFRASYFPFTEPSAEVDISCIKCNGKGCRICSHTGWLEVMGCGMVHPNVLKNLDIDPDKYTGFAFGGGVERFAMLKYGIPDIRFNFVNDLRFLQQFF